MGTVSPLLTNVSKLTYILKWWSSLTLVKVIWRIKAEFLVPTVRFSCDLICYLGILQRVSRWLNGIVYIDNYSLLTIATSMVSEWWCTMSHDQNSHSVKEENTMVWLNLQLKSWELKLQRESSIYRRELNNTLTPLQLESLETNNKYICTCIIQECQRFI
jgi:hypothetical protein